MIIVGAKGFAKELLEVCHQLGRTENLVFFDNVSNDLPNKLFNQFPILKTENEVKEHFTKFGKQFSLGLGNPEFRKKMSDQFQLWGGELTSLISPTAQIGSFQTIIQRGSNIMSGTVITNDVFVDEGCLINLNCTIGHDSKIGKYCELCPGVHISGNVSIGEQCFIGTGAVVLPSVQLGNNVIVGAGSIVTKNIENNSIVMGIPAKKKID